MIYKTTWPFVFQEKAEDTLHKMVSNPKLLAQGSLQEALITPIPPGDSFFRPCSFPEYNGWIK
jgi:hypothetical protein